VPLVILLIVLTLVLLDAYWWRRADRWLRPLRRARWWRGLLAAYMALQLLGLAWVLFGRLIGLAAAERVPGVVVAAVYLWHLLTMPLPAVVCLLADAAIGALALVRSQAENGAAAHDKPVEAPLTLAGAAAPRMTRRQVLGVTVAAVPPALTAGLAAYSLAQVNHFRVRRLDLAIPTLPPDLDGLTIAHVTDVHVGRFTTGRVLNRIVEQSNALRADLVLMTGDLINMSLSDLPVALDAVRRLDAKYGVYLCEGNHDLIESGRAFRRRTKAAGVPLLVNEQSTMLIRGVPLQLLGLRWGTGLPVATRAAERGDEAIRAAFANLMQQRRPDAFPILLAHHPHAFDPAAEAGIPLTLSGHTHGGQLMLTKDVGFGPIMFRYWSGLYERGDSKLFVSNGVGNWFPLRTHAPAEIAHLTLRRAR
jgi:predicted MPP superfamily phosphohydrolase